MRPEPSGPKEQIADAALQFIVGQLQGEGLTPEHVFVTFNVEERDSEGENATSAYYAEGDEENLPDMLAFLLAQAKGIGKKLGLTIVLLDGRGRKVGYDD
jgi:hypothetical protein